MRKSSSDTLRVALLGGEANWAGAMELLRVLMSGVSQAQHHIRPFILLPAVRYPGRAGNIKAIIKNSLDVSLRDRKPKRFKLNSEHNRSFLDFISEVDSAINNIIYYDDRADGLAKTLSLIGADAALPLSTAPQHELPCPYIGHLVDWQHRAFHENFSRDECFKRDIEMARLIMDAPITIANSLNVKEDTLAYFPWANPSNIRPLPFCPQAPLHWLDSSDDDVHAIYGLPEKYFLISNQFWKHKDHHTAILAFSELLSNHSQMNSGVSLICTGSTGDYRNPDHIKSILGLIESLNLTERVKLLGHIPKRHQIEIMKHSLALIQPTLFEGTAGGLSANNAASIGTPILLSDIAVNQETKGANITFFKARDSSDLCGAMINTLLNPPIRPSKQELANAIQSNREKMGHFLVDTIQCAIKTS